VQERTFWGVLTVSVCARTLEAKSADSTRVENMDFIVAIKKGGQSY